ncbi:transporter substrate-binding domain-containing protein [Paraburkholderia sp. BCC1884]|uniref:transporter substrate-binding domain-containing protein n=1 Tax=Paraburkholderia sp. BCC1884 TaxID=2562668 RepID=UPI0011822087|nr:transporter substrate-binding domain-containing protein [Paraburkholderia sp. BCC1884]
MHRSFLDLRQMKFIGTFLVSLTIGMSTVHAQGDNALQRLRQASSITIANTQASPPWSQIDDQNQPAGYDVDVATEVAKRIGVKKVTFIADTFSNFIDGLRVGKYDIVVNSMAATAPRKKIVDFSAPYAPQEFRIWVSDKVIGINGVNDLAGRDVGVEAGTSNEVWARAHLTSSKIHSYDNGGFLYNDLASGRIDAVIESHFAGLKEKQINHLPIHESGPVLTISLGCVAISKNQPELVDAINQAIGDMIADGTLERLGHKWLGADYDVVGDIHKATQPPG